MKVIDKLKLANAGDIAGWAMVLASVVLAVRA